MWSPSPARGGGSGWGSVLAGLEKAAAGVALALHRHDLAAEQRDDFGIRRSAERAPRRLFRAPLWSRSPSSARGIGGQSPSSARGIGGQSPSPARGIGGQSPSPARGGGSGGGLIHSP